MNCISETMASAFYAISAWKPAARTLKTHLRSQWQDEVSTPDAFRRHLYGTPQLAEASRFLAEIPAELLELVRRPGGPTPAAPRAPGAVRGAVHAHAVRANPVEIAPQRWQAGQRVEHAKYGQGTVLKSTMTRSGEEVVIRFDGAGMKIFAVADAVLYAAG